MILAAVWKKTFQRTPFHILLICVTFTDLCTGLINQPFLAASVLLQLTNPGVVNFALSPIAVVGNTVILAAIWKKTFQRTLFHILLSCLAVTELCTGLITQPFLAATVLLEMTNPGVVIARSVLIKVISTTGYVSFIYFAAATFLTVTLMSVERWLHMSR